MATNQEIVSAFYLAYYGRPADTGGLAYWTNQLDLVGGNLDGIVGAFANSAESTANFGALTPAQHIAQLYQDLLGRAPEADGAAYWLGEVTSGRMTIAQLAINVYNGAQGADASIVAVRQQVADQFTAALPANGTGYSGQGAIEAARLVIQAANTSTSPTDLAALVSTGVTLAATATTNPALITALTGPNGNLSDLLATSAGAANPLDMVNLVNTVLATAASGTAPLSTLLGSGTLADVINQLPAGATLTGLNDAIISGGLSGGAVVVNPGSGGGGGGGGGGGTPPATFTVTDDGSGNFTVGTSNGNVTVTSDGTTYTFTPTTGTAVTVPVASINGNLIVNTITLTGTAAHLSGETITGTGTVAVTALDSTANANLSLITTNTVTANVAGDVNFEGNLGKAAITVASGTMWINDATTIGTATFSVSAGALLQVAPAKLAATAVDGSGVLALVASSSDTNFDGQNLATSLEVALNVANGVTLDLSANTNLASIDYYWVTGNGNLTLSAEQVSGKVVGNSSGIAGGNLTIKGLTGTTDLSKINTGGDANLQSVSGTVTADVNLTNVDLTKLTALTVGATDGDVVTATVTPQQYAALKGKVTVGNNDFFKSTDTTAPTTTIASAAYDEDSNTLTLTGIDFQTLLETGETATTDIKGRLDWTKLTWDINGDDSTTANVTFALADISSAKATSAATLAIKLTDAKGSALKSATGYGVTGNADTIDVAAGFARDLSDNAATTDALSNGAIVIAADTTVPTITSVTAPDNATYKAAQNLDFTVTFSEAVNVTDMPLLQLTIGSETKYANYSGGTGTNTLTFRYVVEANLTDADGITVTSPINVSADGTTTIKDGAGNNATLTFTPPTTTGVLVDTTAPTISAVSIPNAAMKIGDVVTVNLTVADATGETLTLKSGSTIGGFTLGGLTKTSDTTYTATFTVTAAGTDVAAGSTIPVSVTLVDPAGNESTQFTTAIAQDADAIDANAPSLTITSDKTAVKAGETATITFTFSEIPTGFAEGDITVTGGTLSGLAVSADTKVYTATFTPTADTDSLTGTISVAGATYTDAAGNSGTASNTVNVTGDTKVPTFTSATTSADGAKVILTYSEALSATTAAAGVFDVKVGGTTANAVTAVTVVGSTVELTLTSAIAHGDVVTVGYTAPTADAAATNAAIQDAAGNDAATLESTTAVTNSVPVSADTTAPTFTSAATNTDGTKVILTYSEALSATTAAADAFVVLVDGGANAVTTAVVNGSTVELTLTTPVTNSQTVTVVYTDPTAGDDANAIQDAAGNDASTLAAQAATNNSAVEAPFTVGVNSGVITFGGTATGPITVTESSGVLTFTRDGNEAATKPEIFILADGTGIPAGAQVTVSETLFASLKEKFANDAAIISGQVTNPTSWSTHINRIADGGISDASFDSTGFMQVNSHAEKFADASITVSAAGNFPQFTTAVLQNLGKFKADGVEGLTLTEVQYNEIISTNQLAKLKDGAATLDNGTSGVTPLDASIVTTIVGSPTAVAKLKDAGIISLVNLDAAQFATLTSKLSGDGGGVAVVDLTGATAAQLATISEGISKVRSEGLSNLTGLDLGDVSITLSVITNLFTKFPDSGANITVIATGASPDEIAFLAQQSGKLKTNGGITGDLNLLNSASPTLNLLTNFYTGSTATVVVVNNENIGEVSTAVLAGKIADDGITGSMTLSSENFGEGDHVGSLLGKTAITANVTLDATGFQVSNLGAVGANIGKVDNLTIDATHGVTAAAADITGKTLVLTGTSAATDFLTLNGTGDADTIDLANITTTTASVVAIGGAGADTVTFKEESSSVLAQATEGDSGGVTLTEDNTHSTVGFDIITGFNAGDAIKLSSAYSGDVGQASGLVATAVTGSTLDSATLTLVNNSVHFIRGTYVGDATNTFVGHASGVDALLIYDADATGGEAYEAVVLVGAGALTAVGGNAGVITIS